ncbi:MAG: hypothetical protein HKN31_14710 [Pricia sp.]|nr:hypothetical protein [Pricia sp.]
MKTSANRNICESCGMPMHHLADFGTNKDDTINTEFCRYCFQNGQFIDHGSTLNQRFRKASKLSRKAQYQRKTLPF